jgi:hypothetical protein
LKAVRFFTLHTACEVTMEYEVDALELDEDARREWFELNAENRDGVEHTYFCPRGCQTYTGCQHPGECGACGAPFQLDDGDYDRALQVLEDNAIAAFVTKEERR